MDNSNINCDDELMHYACLLNKLEDLDRKYDDLCINTFAYGGIFLSTVLLLKKYINK